MTLYVDQREFRSKVPKHLKEMGDEFITKQLETADYIITNNETSIGLERKTALDYIISISDGRLNNQLYKMSTNFEYSMMAIEGDLFMAIEERDLHINALFSSLAGTILRRSPDGKQGVVSIIPTMSQIGTARFIHYINKKMTSNHGLVRLPHLARIKINENERASSILSCFPKVGEKRSEDLLIHFGSLEAVFNAEQHELRRVKGVGKGIADKIKEVLTRDYEVDDE